MMNVISIVLDCFIKMSKIIDKICFFSARRISAAVKRGIFYHKVVCLSVCLPVILVIRDKQIKCQQNFPSSCSPVTVDFFSRRRP